MQIRFLYSSIVLAFCIASVAYAQPTITNNNQGSAAGAENEQKIEVGYLENGEPDTTNMPPLGFYERTTIPEKRRPVPYTYVREADVLWSKIIWRKIDLRQKINLPLYYPTVRMRDRKSITQALYDAIQNKEIYAYDPLPSFSSPGDEFVKRMTLEDVHKQMYTEGGVIVMPNIQTGKIDTFVVESEMRFKDVRELLLKEEWFFDSKRSLLEVRVLGICPILETVNLNGSGGDMELSMAFWVYYPEARKVLTHIAAYNNRNDAQSISFDDLIFKRRFDSYIIRESNEYENRAVNEYKKGGIPNMLESERIHYDIFNTEHDLWEF